MRQCFDQDALHEALDRLQDDDGHDTPLALPAALVDALRAASGLGLDATAVLRDAVELFAQRLALDVHCASLGWEPSLTELAVAAARLDGSPLADDNALLSRAAELVVSVKPDAEAVDVVVFAAGMLAGEVAGRAGTPEPPAPRVRGVAAAGDTQQPGCGSQGATP